MDQSSQHFQRRGFSGSVCAEEADDFSSRDFKADVLDGFNFFIGAVKKMCDRPFEPRVLEGDGINFGEVLNGDAGHGWWGRSIGTDSDFTGKWVESPGLPGWVEGAFKKNLWSTPILPTFMIF